MPQTPRRTVDPNGTPCRPPRPSPHRTSTRPRSCASCPSRPPTRATARPGSPRQPARRPASRRSASTSSCGRPRATRPRGPSTSGAAQSALSTASSVASTVGGEQRRRGPRRRTTTSRAARLGARPPARRREREEDLAAAVVRDRAGAREAEPGAAREPLELRRAERRVGREHGDAAPGRRARGSAPAAASARPTGTPSTRRSGAEPKFASTSTPTVAPRLGHDAARGADPALPLEADHAGAGADRALRDRARRARPRAPGRASAASTCTIAASLSQLSSHSPTTGITTSSAPTAGSAATAAVDRAVVDPADRHRRRQVDRRLERPPLARR